MHFPGVPEPTAPGNIIDLQVDCFVAEQPAEERGNRALPALQGKKRLDHQLPIMLS